MAHDICQFIQLNLDGLCFPPIRHKLRIHDMQRLLTSFPENKELNELRRNLRERTHAGHAGGNGSGGGWGSWDENWGRVVKPLVISEPSSVYTSGMSSPLP